ncbi:MAG: hypothetical protein HQK53_04155 [Oligoflexia bacterium]|nr:hypothetical protein [Oligoflexia bacterium]
MNTTNKNDQTSKNVGVFGGVFQKLSFTEDKNYEIPWQKKIEELQVLEVDPDKSAHEAWGQEFDRIDEIVATINRSDARTDAGTDAGVDDSDGNIQRYSLYFLLSFDRNFHRNSFKLYLYCQDNDLDIIFPLSNHILQRGLNQNLEISSLDSLLLQTFARYLEREDSGYNSDFNSDSDSDPISNPIDDNDDNFDNSFQKFYVEFSFISAYNVISRMAKWHKLLLSLESTSPAENIFLDFNPTEVNFSLHISRTTNGPWKIWGKFNFNSNSNSNSNTTNDIVDLWDINAVFCNQLILYKNTIYRFIPEKYFTFIGLLQQQAGLQIPQNDLAKFIFQLFNKFDIITIKTSTDLSIINTYLPPLSILYLRTRNLQQQGSWGTSNSIMGTGPSGTGPSIINGQVWFRYANKEIPAIIHRDLRTMHILSAEMTQQGYGENGEGNSTCNGINTPNTLNLVFPKISAEKESISLLSGCDNVTFKHSEKVFNFHSSQLLTTIYRLFTAGWEVWAENIKITILQSFSIQATAKQDWLELTLKDTSSSKIIEAWQLVHILKKKSLFIKLGDGTLGVLPEEWFNTLAKLYEHTADGKFSFASADRLDALKNLDPNFQGDDIFNELSSRIKNINGLPPLSPAPTFKATLRKYQEDGLAWLSFLDKFSLGGLLADEMGLGKTVQILAFLDYKKNIIPSAQYLRCLLIAPKSLLSLWENESNRFAPQLSTKIIDSSNAAAAAAAAADKRGYDILIISYTLLRKHIEIFSSLDFEYIILDEAQTIKNSAALISRAVKTLHGRIHIALSGTPIENHIGEVCSIFEFINPRIMSMSGLSPDSSPEKIKLSFQEIRPFILRRMKQDVLPDLPTKNEEAIYLPLEEEQEAIYEKLKYFYRRKLKKIENELGELSGPKDKHCRQDDHAGGLDSINGIDDFHKYKFIFLEGLLRLRQIACHPLLIKCHDETTAATLTSNKVEFLLAKLCDELIPQHKVLIFSQFTSFLSLIRKELDQREIAYEYLDGQTQNRQDIVNNFQRNDQIKLFLIGLKSGGLGLNLTAADYCFILDPWWNPAVEKQAVDRLHRIGQKKNVFVYKLISKNTVEEKILILHQHKLEQAEYLKTSENAFLENLSAKDFDFLFSD